MGTLDRPREADSEQVTDPDGAALLAGLGEKLKAHKLTAEISGGRLRVSAGPGGRAGELACLRRAGDGDRWWFSWGGGIWLCEADNAAEAVTQVKGALRRVGK